MKIVSDGKSIEIGGSGVTMDQVNAAIDEKLDDYTPRDIYSAEEQVVGQWVNGKPLYRRVFNCKIPDNLPVQPTYLAYKFYEFNSMDTVVSLRGMLTTQVGGVGLSYTMGGTDVAQLYYSIPNNQFGILIGKTQMSQSIKAIYIIMEYTKVADAATATFDTNLNTVYTGKQTFDFITTE